ncbi:MAG: hypothetical protein A2848_03405 [Candidatus Magasanikbacteria bacterium RIFCSPHIGHO2_01_FULL_50_8]|uniref:DUF4325 domain-containing protein n=1 Tax=Candidatus Magasanikbacteria bacterium RIFCSPHIGHO2_01_FULL_50_8 TaxID=1798674 RepID=A0A1F6LR18_9BACT|nr:MAG: hypothetical protein A2848_03405 [Candidatus Magasanikbacteria bacterium RIFCSPHIGHO2_01_FULL_50_8]
MRIEIKKFGDILTSHPAGRDAFLVASAYIFPDCTNENIILDFAGVEVLSPSWGDEFITKVVEKFGDKVSFENTENPSVKATLDILHKRPTA